MRTAAAARVELFDIGAGIHNLAPHIAYSTSRLHPDDSDALWLLSRFEGRADVHAWEVNSAAAKQLRRAADERPMTRNLARQLVVHRAGVGAASGSSRVALCGSANTYAITGVAQRSGAKCSQGESVNITSLDDFVRKGSNVAPLYVKVDTEGGEFDVLHGAADLLRAGRIEMLSFEYSANWDRGLRRGAAKRAPPTRTLRRFTSVLSGWGYDTYLISAPASGRLALVPIYGRFWHSDWEICANRTKFYHGHCWNDLLVVKSCGCGKRVVFERILPNASRDRNRLLKGGRKAAANTTGNSYTFPECPCF